MTDSNTAAIVEHLQSAPPTLDDTPPTNPSESSDIENTPNTQETMAKFESQIMHGLYACKQHLSYTNRATGEVVNKGENALTWHVVNRVRDVERAATNYNWCKRHIENAVTADHGQEVVTREIADLQASKKEAKTELKECHHLFETAKALFRDIVHTDWVRPASKPTVTRLVPVDRKAIDDEPDDEADAIASQYPGLKT